MVGREKLKFRLFANKSSKPPLLSQHCDWIRKVREDNVYCDGVDNGACHCYDNLQADQRCVLN